MKDWIDVYAGNGDYLALGVIGALVLAGKIRRRGGLQVFRGSANVGPKVSALLDQAYLLKGSGQRRKILDGCVRHEGYRECFDALVALERQPELQRKHGAKLAEDHRYLIAKHGSVGSAKRSGGKARRHRGRSSVARRVRELTDQGITATEALRIAMTEAS